MEFGVRQINDLWFISRKDYTVMVKRRSSSWMGAFCIIFMLEIHIPSLEWRSSISRRSKWSKESVRRKYLHQLRQIWSSELSGQNNANCDKYRNRQLENEMQKSRGLREFSWKTLILSVRTRSPEVLNVLYAANL
ncbi:unnamed protein product [Acanthoscelides obtectus]|uniref:Uncharacterized protein n=1 Tax=Acanthoscelides obtectus TaxID=200917 RepID=A0A9P0P7H2_ACAOB|nr:unnamed protein product [Acanthoscelides obtectus]CAK1655379.1 hypothetical protein AOBTE_LOCUS19161 [Acanthoscelides obtectus]